MSNNEKIFEQWLIDNNVEYEYQPIIENVAFSKSGKYKADFKVYTRDKSEYVIVEIKGFMTYEAVNKLKYLLTVHPENICVFQMTEKDWLHMPIQDSIDMQFYALNAFIENGHPEKLNEQSFELLYKYINCKNMEYIKYASPYIEYRDIDYKNLDIDIKDVRKLMNDYINENLKDIELSDFAAIYKGCTIPAGVLTEDEYPVDKTSIEILLKKLILDLIFDDRYRDCNGPDIFLDFPNLKGLRINRTGNIISIYCGYLYEWEFSIAIEDFLNDFIEEE